MAGNSALAATLFMQDQRGVARVLEITHLHPYHRADTNESEQHHGHDRLIPQRNNIVATQRIE